MTDIQVIWLNEASKFIRKKRKKEYDKESRRSSFSDRRISSKTGRKIIKSTRIP